MPTDLPSPILFLARLLIGGAFLIAGIRNLPVLDRLAGFVGSRGVPMPRQALWLATAIQLVASVLVIIGVWLVPATLGLIAFIIGATVIFHHFWDFQGEERVTKRNSFSSNVIILGGLLALLATAI